MDEDEILSPVLEASISNPNDPYKMTIIAEAASVGTTDPLFSNNKRVKWTADQLRKYASTMKGMPITLKFDEEGKLEDHAKTPVGIVEESYFDEGKQKVMAIGSLWKHYFPDTLKQFASMYSDEDAEKRPQVSWEFSPEGLQELTDEGADVVTPTDGRFSGLALIAKGADRGNAIALLASAAKREGEAVQESLSDARPGSFEWIGDKVAQVLSASSNVDNYVPKDVVATFSDHAIYREGDKHFKLPYTIEGNAITFSDTIEVEPIYQPLGASAAGSTSEEDPTLEEADKPVDEEKLKELQASAAKVPDLEAENQRLATENDTLQASLNEANQKVAEFETEREEKAKEELAASRMAEVEKITPYADAQEKSEALEAFKTMDEKSFGIIKRTLSAAAEVKGGVSSEARIDPPASREDEDGAARSILESDDYKSLKASLANQEDK